MKKLAIHLVKERFILWIVLLLLLGFIFLGLIYIRCSELTAIQSTIKQWKELEKKYQQNQRIDNRLKKQSALQAQHLISSNISLNQFIERLNQLAGQHEIYLEKIKLINGRQELSVSLIGSRKDEVRFLMAVINQCSAKKITRFHFSEEQIEIDFAGM